MTPESAAHHLAHLPGTLWFDGGAAGQGWSLLLCEPSEVREQALPPAAPGTAHADLPFLGGWAGLVTYEGALTLLGLEPPGAAQPRHGWWGRYDAAACYDHARQEWTLTGHGPGRAQLERALRAPPPGEPAPAPTPRPTRSWSYDDYQPLFGEVQQALRAGEIYQANLTRPITGPPLADPWSAYRRLRRRSAPAYGFWATLDVGVHVLGNSPELLLAADADQLRSTPIKGTRPRHLDPDLDREACWSLQESEKEKAELTMIVDLVRNDLARVAVPGSVRAHPRQIAPYPYVWHAEQPVTARLRPGRTALDALTSLLPAGSVTGAPKRRAVEHLLRWEQTPRGVYCGSAGFCSDEGTARFNVAIRTALSRPEGVQLQVGGGIVLDSRPLAEWDETHLKAGPLLHALGLEEAWPR